MTETAARRPKIGLVGYYGYGNYGDELFRLVLRDKLPEFEFEVVDVRGLSDNPAYRSRFLAEFAAVVIGGGDLLIPSGWAEWYFSPGLLAKPVLLFGVGVPTWAGVKAEVVEKLKAYVNHASVRLVALRDAESAAWVQANLAPSAPVLCFADMVCAMTLPAASKPAGAPIFTLISRHQRPGGIGWDNIAALCDRARLYGYRVRHVVLGTGKIRADDLSTLEGDRPEIAWELEQSDSLERLTEWIGESAFVASMKFHGCVVAAMYGAPAVILATTDKFTNFLRLIERPDLYGHHTHKDLAERLPRFVAPIPSHTVAFLRADAERGLAALRAALRAAIG